MIDPEHLRTVFYEVALEHANTERYPWETMYTDPKTDCIDGHPNNRFWEMLAERLSTG